MGHRKIWTPAKWRRAQRMKAAGAEMGEIAEALHFTQTQVTQRFYNQRYVRAPRTSPAGIVISVKASDIALAEREARAEAARLRTPTQIIFGDPPPGYSALDKKRQGIAP